MKKLFFSFLCIASFLILNTNYVFARPLESMDDDVLSVSFTLITHVSCYGGSDGSLIATALGGSGNYTYQWNDGHFGFVATNLSVGLATVTVTDNDDGSTAQTSIIITQPDLLIATAILNQPIDCANPTASASVVVTGGIPFYSYYWDNGEFGETVTNLTVGQHSVTITDFNLCTTTDIVNVYENIEYPIANAGPDVSIDCANPNPMVTLDGTGSSEGFAITYLWFTSDGTIIANPTGLSPLVNNIGTYTLLVTNNENGCTATDEVVVGSDFEEPIVSAGDDLTICVGDCIELTAIAALGTPPYTFGWNQGIGLGQTQTVCPIITTTYSVTVTGANGCQATDDVTVFVSPIPLLDMQNDTICQGACTTLIPITGSIVSYEWDNDLFGQFPSVCPSETTTYSLTVTDGNGCTNTAQVEVFVYEIPYVEVADAFVCFNECATLEAFAEGGSGVFTTLWSTGDTSLILEVCPDSTALYSVTITDENACQATDNAMVNVNTELVVIAESDYQLCEGSVVTACVIVTGGTLPYTYGWSNSQSFPNECLDFSSPGTSGVTVTDANGCTATTFVTIFPAPPPPVIELADTVICVGNCVTLLPVVVGGAAPYTFAWSTGEVTNSITVCPTSTTTYFFEVIDVSGCLVVTTVVVEVLSVVANAGEDFTFPCTNLPTLMGEGSSTGNSNIDYLWTAMAGGTIDTGAATATPQVSTPGTYIFTVRNGIGCEATDTIIVHPAEIPVITAEISLISCNNANDGAVDITVSGATPPYAFSWSNGAITADLSNLPAETYNLTVTDVGDCSATFSFELLNPAPLSVSLSTIHESAPNANDGIVSANGIGGTLPYTYLWNTGDTTNILTTLVPGIYDVTLTDANGCSVLATTQVLADGCEMMEIISINNSPICPESNDGFVQINQVLGGQVPYQYTWSNGDTLAIAQNLFAGTITCTVTDDNDCIGVFVFEIMELDTLTPILIVQDITLYLDEMGMASFSFDMIDNGSSDNCQIDSVFIEQTSFDCNNIGENEVEIAIFDLVPLSDVATIIVTVEDTLAPVFDFCPDNIISNNCTEVFYQLPVASDNCDTINIEMTAGLAAGASFPEGETLVEFTATDAAGNTAICAFTVTVTNDLTVLLEAEAETNMDENGTVFSTVSGGAMPYSYVWIDIDGNAISTEDTLFNVGQGEYCLLLTDATGCTFTACAEVDNVVLVVEGLPAFSITVLPNPASDVFGIYFTRKVNQEVVVRVMNAAKQQVLAQTATEIHSIDVNISHLPAGLYFVKIAIGEYIFMEKLVINR